MKIKYSIKLHNDTMITAIVNEDGYALCEELCRSYQKFVEIFSDEIFFYPPSDEFWGLPHGQDRININIDQIVWFFCEKV